MFFSFLFFVLVFTKLKPVHYHNPVKPARFFNNFDSWT